MGGFLAFGFGFGFRLDLFGLVGNLGVLIYGWHFVRLVVRVDLIWLCMGCGLLDYCWVLLLRFVCYLVIVVC